MEDSIYRQTVEDLDEEAQLVLGDGLSTLLYGDKSEVIKTVSYSAPLIYSLQVVLCRYLAKKGLVPDVVVGHSMGEYAAAHVAGAFDYQTGLRLLTRRNQLIEERVRGDMLVVLSPADNFSPLLTTGETIALYNSPKNTVVSALAEQLTELQKRLKEQKIASIPLRCSVPFHSPLMETIMSDYSQLLGEQLVKPIAGNVCFYSAITNQIENLLTQAYWEKNTRQPVQFFQSLQEINSQFDISQVVEIGPNNTLSSFWKESNSDATAQVNWCLKKGDSSIETMKIIK